MGMPREGELDGGLWDDVASPMSRVVTHQHCEAVALEPFHRLGQVAIGWERWTTVILNTCNDKRVFASVENTMFVEQERPALTANATLEFLHIGRTFIFFRISDIHAVIMVAHHRIDSIRGGEFAEITLESVQLHALVIH